MLAKRPDLTFLGIAIFVLLLLAGFTWQNYQFATQNPGGNDFIPRYFGTRLWITQGLSPYSEETTTVIQDFLHGHPATGPEDRGFFVYPYYSMLVFFPYALVGDYDMARALWMTTFEASLVILAFVSLALARWKPTYLVYGILFLFSLGWYHGVRPVINGNSSVIVAVFIALAFLSIRARKDDVGAILLTLASIKPQMVVLLTPFVVIWAISQKRYRLVTVLVGAHAFLVFGSLVLQPDWILANLRQIVSYPTYSPPGTPREIFALWWPLTGETLGWMLTIGLGILLVREWIVAWGKDFDWFLWTASLTLLATNMIGIPATTENYLALFPGLILVLAAWDKRWGRAGRVLIVVTLLGFLVGLWALFLATIAPGQGTQPTQHGVLFFPLPLFLFITLYWMRWWIVKPPRTVLETRTS